MPATPDTARPETILAFDYGRRRIGVAVGQQITASASALGAVGNGDNGPDWSRIESMIADWQPARLVVGLPLLPDGSPSELGEVVREFRVALERFGLPIESVDERYSSLEAESLLKEQRRAGLRGRIRKEAIDAAAAVTIAERWLQS
jgi:putative Holliday junction resolvase